MSREKPEDARHLKNALAHASLDRDVLQTLCDKALNPKFTTRVLGFDCILSTRTGSQDMPQLKLERDGKIIQILCTHAVALHRGDVPQHWYEELSHLCGIRQCLVHTKWELPWENISRDGCHKYGHFNVCPHNPPCLPEAPFDKVKEAIQAQRQKTASAAQADPKKERKRLQNQKDYQRRKKAKEHAVVQK